LVVSLLVLYGVACCFSDGGSQPNRDRAAALPLRRARACGLAAMNTREMIDLRELLERLDRLLKEYLMASSPERLAFVEAEITAAEERLQRIAASFIN
jgi:hypothetical protein